MKIIRLFTFIIIIMTLFSCTKNRVSAYSLGNVKIDTTIKKDIIFRWLDGQNDFDMMGEGVRKKTSLVLYYSKWKEELEIPPSYSYNNCRARIVNDTLIIRIGTTTYLSDNGINIKYKNGKYYAIPFSTSDIFSSEDLKKKPPREIYFLRNRKLVLDKYNYKIGDSVFGRIHIEVEEPKKNKFTTEHIADGYFRAKVVKAGEI